jgi:hypothetical protein
MPKKLDKVIVTNDSALVSKYGASGARSVRAAVARLITADRARGLVTRFVALDDAQEMRQFRARPVARSTDARQNKQAIDDLYLALAPDYILLLGSSDVIPQQRLDNPVYSARGEDNDLKVASDLPYACESRYGTKISQFVGPTRVVARLPDIAGEHDPSYLLGLIKTAAAARPMGSDEYSGRFVISAQIWQRSTRESMRKMFGDSHGILQVPPRKSSWGPKLLQSRLHFINCHGASRSSEFFGQPASGKSQYPIALKASYINGKISTGTLAAAECCYGGQLERFSPSHALPGICETYLGNGAWGFVGSTTIAYGDTDANGDADLVCQYFMESSLAGASLGRAFLEARQKFIGAASPLHPLDLKTLAQFNLYADPSIIAVRGESLDVTASGAPSLKAAQAERSARHDRRRALFKQGTSLAEREPIPKRTRTTQSTTIKRALYSKARSFKLLPKRALSFAIRYRGGRKAMPRGLTSDAALPRAYHLLLCASPTSRKGSGFAARSGIPNIVALIGKEVDGALVSIARLDSR